MIGGTKRMCEEFVLSNGLRVVAEPIENFPSVSVGLWIGAGSMYESAEENGLSHFVEHILFKSTERRTTKDIAVEMDALLAEYHPDYRSDGFTTIQIGPNRGEKAPVELELLLELL